MEASFTIPPWALYTASWFGMMAGVWALFDRAEKVASKESKQWLSTWLQNIETPTTNSSPATFNHIFNRVFGEKHFSVRCVGMSVLASITFLAILIAFWAAIRIEDAAELFSSSGGLSSVLLLGGFLNILPDYISLLQTRVFIRLLAKATSLRRTVILIVADFILTGLIFLASFGLFWIAVIFSSRSTFDWGSFQEFIRLLLVPNESMNSALGGLSFGPFLCTTYATSLWLWLYILSAAISKALGLGKTGIQAFQFLFNYEEKPITSLGFVSMLIVSVFYLAIPLSSVFSN